MIEIYENIYVGNESDFYAVKHQSNWATLHCCKNPFHCNMVGYRGSLPSTHPNYAFCRSNNEMSLNLVDMDKFSANYLGFNKNMFEQAFAFLDEYRNKGYKILIHCNQGESRGPSIGLLYVSYIGKYNYADFDLSVEQFRKIYPLYNPKQNIYMTIKSLWNDFVVEK